MGDTLRVLFECTQHFLVHSGGTSLVTAQNALAGSHHFCSPFFLQLEGCILIGILER